MPGSSGVKICGKSGAARRAEQGGLEEPADELRLTAGSGFRENALCVRSCCRLGNFKLRCGGEKPVAANEFHENACLGAGQSKLDGKALGRGVEVGGRVDDEKGGGRPVEVEACRGPGDLARGFHRRGLRLLGALTLEA
jgi:hypothetical protein